MKNIIKEIRQSVRSNDSEEIAHKISNWQRRILERKISAYSLVRLINHLAEQPDEPVEDDVKCFVAMDATDVDLDQLMLEVKNLKDSNNALREKTEELSKQIAKQKSFYSIAIVVLVLILIAVVAAFIICQ